MAAISAVTAEQLLNERLEGERGRYKLAGAIAAGKARAEAIRKELRGWEREDLAAEKSASVPRTASTRYEQAGLYQGRGCVRSQSPFRSLGPATTTSQVRARFRQCATLGGPSVWTLPAAPIQRRNLEQEIGTMGDAYENMRQGRGDETVRVHIEKLCGVRKKRRTSDVKIRVQRAVLLSRNSADRLDPSKRSRDERDRNP